MRADSKIKDRKQAKQQKKRKKKQRWNGKPWYSKPTRE